TSLVDFNNDVVNTSLGVAHALGARLWGVRVDTSESLVDRAILRELEEKEGAANGELRGVPPRLVELAREALDRNGYRHVGLGVAGLAKGATAMGLPLIATPILASVFGPKQAVVIITIPIFVANTILVLQSWRVLGYLRTLVPLILANAAGTVVGALLLAG